MESCWRRVHFLVGLVWLWTLQCAFTMIRLIFSAMPAAKLSTSFSAWCLLFCWWIWCLLSMRRLRLWAHLLWLDESVVLWLCDLLGMWSTVMGSNWMFCLLTLGLCGFDFVVSVKQQNSALHCSGKLQSIIWHGRHYARRTAGRMRRLWQKEKCWKKNLTLTVNVIKYW